MLTEVSCEWEAEGRGTGSNLVARQTRFGALAGVEWLVVPTKLVFDSISRNSGFSSWEV